MTAFKNFQPEDTIQKRVVEFFLELEKLGGFTFFAVIGGSVRVAPHIGKRMKDMGARSGVHDLVFLLPVGKAIFIELKAMDGGLKPNQRAWDGIVSGLGFVSYCVKGQTGNDVICRVLDILEAHGFAQGTVRPLTINNIARKYT